MTHLEQLRNISELVNNSGISNKEKINRIQLLVSKNDFRTKSYSLDDIAKQVFLYTGISTSLMNVKTRKREVVQARQLAHYKAKNLTNHSLSEIGFYFGRKDHATVAYSVKTVENMIEFDKTFREQHEQFLNE